MIFPQSVENVVERLYTYVENTFCGVVLDMNFYRRKKT